MFNLIPRKRNSQASAAPGSLQETWEPCHRLSHELDRLTHDFFTGFLPAFGEEGFGWGFHVEDKDDALVITAEAPGFEPGDFEISVERNRLTLRAEHKSEKKEKEGQFHERRHHRFYRSVTLPDYCRSDGAEAEYKNGVLTVKLPKAEESKPKRIAIAS